MHLQILRQHRFILKDLDQNRRKSQVSMEEGQSAKSWVRGENDQAKLYKILKEQTHRV